MRIIYKHSFDAAHRLFGYNGLCKNLHGHRYVVEFVLEGEKLDSLGMLVDFGVLKKILGGWIDRWWDHAVLYNAAGDLQMLAALGKIDGGSRRFGFSENPTAENMAKHLLAIGDQLLREAIPHPSYSLVAVRVWETPDRAAEATK